MHNDTVCEYTRELLGPLRLHNIAYVLHFSLNSHSLRTHASHLDSVMMYITVLL